MNKVFQGISGIKVLAQQPLAGYTSLGIGGPARYLVLVKTKRSLQQLLAEAHRRRLRIFVMGRGTNLLVSDKGFSGVVIKLAGNFKRIRHEACCFQCGAAATGNEFAQYALRAGYSGAEFLFGIPGTIGGGVRGNAGAWGHCLAEIVARVTVIDDQGRERILDRSAIGFSYRHSDLTDKLIITAVEMHLVRCPVRHIRKTMEDYAQRRARKQPRAKSAGSFFKNPIQEPAGRLIEKCGLKGFRIGDAQVSVKHANFIINRGHARAADVRALVRIIKQKVYRQTGIRLEEEVKFLP